MLNYVNFNGKRFDVNYGSKSLTISGQNIEDIKTIENLDKLNYLVELNLQNNNIVEIEGIEHLINLKYLYLNNNGITEIKGLEKLVNLEYLSLNTNSIIEIKGVEHLINLKILNLYSNSIEEISGLNKLSQLEGLYLSNNNISEIKGLNKLRNLQNLDLGDNPITKLEGLDSLEKLTRLGLQNTNIDPLLIEKLGGFHGAQPHWVGYPDRFIKYCCGEYVEIGDEIRFIESNQLHLSQLGITDLHDLKHLEKVSNVELLSLVDNKIKEIKNLEQFINLKTLWLSFNEIERIENIDYLSNLKYLSLQNNRIKEILGLRTLTNLKELKLNDNNIKDISGIKPLNRLTDLDLSNNTEIEDISKINNLISLKNLNLENTSITEFPILNLNNLVELNLSKNLITEIPKLNLPELKVLNLSNNLIKTMDSLCQFPNLGYLNLNNNEIEELECIDKMMYTLNKFYIDNNKLNLGKDLIDKLIIQDDPVYPNNNSRRFLLYVLLKNYFKSCLDQVKEEIDFDDLIKESTILQRLRTINEHPSVRDIVKMFRQDYEIQCGPNKIPLKIITPESISPKIDDLLRVVGPDIGYKLDHIVKRLQLCSEKALMRLLRTIQDRRLWNIEFYYTEIEIRRATDYRITQKISTSYQMNDSFKKPLSILHFTDLHFGEYSMQKEERKSGDFDNYFVFLKKKIQDVIKDEQVGLAVISGDFCSKNHFFLSDESKRKELPEYLVEFLEIFSSSGVPLILSIGNHEINRDIEHHQYRTELYLHLIDEIKQQFNSDFSKKFEKNYINYKIFQDLQIIIFSVDTTSNLDENNNWEGASLNLRDIEAFFEEIEQNGIKLKDFKKIIACHHPLNKIDNYEHLLPSFIRDDIIYVLSGHEHDKKKSNCIVLGTNKEIINFIAGSPFLNLERKMEGQLWDPIRSQFNLYKLSGSQFEFIEASYYIFNENKNWEKKILYSKLLSPAESNLTVIKGDLGEERWIKSEIYDIAEKIKLIYIKRATHQGSEDAEYEKYRQELLSISEIRPIIPSYVRNCVTLDDFWQLIRAKFKSYQDRREEINKSFQELLDYLL